jgi:hypothetical protein
MKPSHPRRCTIMGWPKQVSSTRDVLKRQFEEERLNRFAVPQFRADWRVILSVVFDGMVENGGIRSESSYR